MHILHAALPEDWAAAEASGSYDVSTRDVSIVEADYIHASTAAQLPGVLARYYADVPAVDLLVIDVGRLEHEGASVVWEDAASAGDGPYPHVYGVLPAVAVSEVLRLEHAPGEQWTVPDLSGHDVAEGPDATDG